MQTTPNRKPASGERVIIRHNRDGTTTILQGQEALERIARSGRSEVLYIVNT